MGETGNWDFYSVCVIIIFEEFMKSTIFYEFVYNFLEREGGKRECACGHKQYITFYIISLFFSDWNES